MPTFIHEKADVLSKNIGDETRIWQYAIVLEKASIGKNCNICAHVFIENDVIIHDRVTVKCGVQIWNGITIEDDVFIGPNVTFTNDRFPRSKCYRDSYEKTYIERGVSIGANATVLPVHIGHEAMIGAGAVVINDVPPFAIITGNPGRITGYVNSQDKNVLNTDRTDLVHNEVIGTDQKQP